jgi:membrane-associated phospholipid phosphatase
MTFELEIIEWMQQFSNAFLDAFFSFWTMFGEDLIIIAIMGFVYWCYNKKAGEYLGLSVFVSLVLNSVIKVLVQRPRPFQVDDQIVNLRPATSGGYAFPSGHTQGASSVFGSVAVWVKKRWVSIVAAIIVVMVALSRMYLGVHYLSDVIVGGILGIGIGLLIFRLFVKTEDHHRLYMRILVIAAVVVLFVYLLELFTASASETMTNSAFLYDKIEGLLKMAGAFAGFVFGVQFEKKHVDFTNHRVIWKNLARFALGVGIVMGIRLGLDFIFSLIIDTETLAEGQLALASIAALFDCIRYGAMVFVAIGVYPLVFKKFNI